MFSTRARKLNSASCGAAGLAPKWPAKSGLKIFPPMSDFGMLIPSAARLPQARDNAD